MKNAALFSALLKLLMSIEKLNKKTKNCVIPVLQMANLWDSNVHNVVSINYIIQKYIQDLPELTN